jgi:hypothetical protein
VSDAEGKSMAVVPVMPSGAAAPGIFPGPQTHALAAELSLLWSASSMDNLRPIDAGLLS